MSIDNNTLTLNMLFHNEWRPGMVKMIVKMASKSGMPFQRKTRIQWLVIQHKNNTQQLSDQKTKENIFLEGDQAFGNMLTCKSTIWKKTNVTIMKFRFITFT